MNQLSAATDELIAIVTGNGTLSSLLGSGWLYIGLPEKYPSITIDGIVRDDSKLTSYTATLKLWLNDQDTDLIYYADYLLGQLKSSSHFVTSGWVSRPEPDNNLYCALFPVTIYV